MEKTRKIELLQRSLGIRHKLKVYDSMKAPDTHEDLAITLLSKWELEDELKAIEEVLGDVRAQNVANRKNMILTHVKKDVTAPGLVRSGTSAETPAATPVQLRK